MPTRKYTTKSKHTKSNHIKIKKTKQKQTRINNSGGCRLIPLNKINNKQLFQLATITKDKAIMKYIGRGNTWSLNDIKQFIKDEHLEGKKTSNKRQYYTFIMVCNNDVIGFIAGRKNKNLLPPESTPYDLLLRMFISRQYSSKGYGKLIIKLFISTYSRILSNQIPITKHNTQQIKLFADIDKDNIASIKIHTANGFIHTDTITYPNKHNYERYEFII